MNQKLLKVLGSRDAAWTTLARYELELENILKNGIENEEDIFILQMSIRTVLGEIICRRAEMEVDESDKT